ncbi:hypothetical protein ACJQWK_03399 [Exserohilum turcicum]
MHHPSHHSSHHPPRLLLPLTTLLDLSISLTLVALFTASYTHHFRTILWQTGGTQGWNSDPQQRIYDYANYRSIPPIPLLWDENSSLEHLSLAVTILFTCVLRARLNTLKSHTLDLYAALATNALYDALLAALCIASAVLQSAPDLSDPEHLSASPWYLERGCADVCVCARSACRVMRASYGVAVFAA